MVMSCRTHRQAMQNASNVDTMYINTRYEGYRLATSYKQARALLVEFLSRSDRPIFLLGSGSNGKTTLLEDVCRTGDLNSSWRVLQAACSSNNFSRPPLNKEIWTVNVMSRNYQQLFEQYTFPYYMIDMNNVHPCQQYSRFRVIPMNEVME